jgi:para-aminobenzoate synthetase component 1
MFSRLSELISDEVPVFFYTDFKGERLMCYPLNELPLHDIEFSFHAEPSQDNFPHKPTSFPVSYDTYREKYERIQEEIRSGNTYLLNLTQPTLLDTSYTLKEIYTMAHAPFKVRVKEEFVSFSPEPFVTIGDNTIHTFPMKGTIDASIPDAIQTILNNPKETAEHTMIVDLLRNDLGIVGNNVRVEKFRFITTIDTGEKKLHQVSSHISAALPDTWKENAGELLRNLLPAGSISGTPKRKTVEIIEKVEGYQRGNFTGVFGYYDGKTLYSAVAIRYIENKGGRLYYKSGGGITAESECMAEYQEMIDKIYIP